MDGETMENNRGTSNGRLRGLLVTGIVTVAALAAMIGVYQGTGQKEPEKTPVAQTEDRTEQEMAGIEYEGYEDVAPTVAERKPEVTAQVDEPIQVETSVETVKDAPKKEVAERQLDFRKDSKMNWPVEGNVIMNYSMDKSIYFATLDQYKYNPAIVIQVPVNEKVVAAAEGKIVEIDTTETTGVTVCVDMGNGYQAVYGQLKEVKKQEGDFLEKGETLGYIAEPTKYYNLEGSNLYFAMTKEEEPINPMEFLD